MHRTPVARYRSHLVEDEFRVDPSQERAVAHFQRLYEDLITAPRRTRNWLTRIFRQSGPTDHLLGLYLWGGTGRGKTYLMDMFYDCLPFAEKKRVHFHRFMKKTHEQLKTLRDRTDPLAVVAERLAGSTRVLCFDEFIVNDIGDAMILSRLLLHLFQSGVVLVATSNIPPEDLYKDGLQRDRFNPAIELIKRYTVVVQVDGSVDYRMRFLDRANIYFTPLDSTARKGLLHNFQHMSPEPGDPAVELEIDGRTILTVRHATGVVWFGFEVLCGGPRSQNDYIELARCFHTFFVSDIPRLDEDSNDRARRLINLVDILYDHNVKLVVSAAAQPEQLYLGVRLRDEFARTISRLIEMQSKNYLAKRHLS